MDVNVNVNNRDFGRILDDPRITAAAVAEAEKIAAIARGIAPRDSGEYASQISVSAERVGVKRPRRGAVVKAEAPYSAAIEFGNTKSPARHVLLNAAQAEGRRG